MLLVSVLFVFVDLILQDMTQSMATAMVMNWGHGFVLLAKGTEFHNPFNAFAIKNDLPCMIHQSFQFKLHYQAYT